jgi:hypothetical protein
MPHARPFDFRYDTQTGDKNLLRPPKLRASVIAKMQIENTRGFEWEIKGFGVLSMDQDLAEQ